MGQHLRNHGASVTELLRAQVASLRAIVGSMQGQIVALEETLALMESPKTPTGCTHASVSNEGTFGAPEYRCDTCHALVEAPG